ncbi:MAG: hypothetical protein DRQ55_04025 [Planctomycetota bacterium]|nr:MAG: hypothetical protein DRQ55_04025 [Planctomycetota bacterium]
MTSDRIRRVGPTPGAAPKARRAALTAALSLALSLALVCLAAAPMAELQITGKVLYRSAVSVPSRGAEVDIMELFANNPAYMRLGALGLSKSSGHGQELFAAADRAAKKALATVARDRNLHVIAVLGGVSGGEVPIEDLTDVVIDSLPVYYIDGTVYHGSKRSTDTVAEMDRQQVWEAIPAYTKWLALSDGDADYYFFKEEYQRAYLKALRQVVRDESLTVVVELGGVTSRLDPPQDVTALVIAAL